MKKAHVYLVAALTLLLVFSSVSGRGRAEQSSAEGPPVAQVWGNRLTVYYPGQKKIFVYSELGGNCIFAYTLSTPGGPVARENCK